MSKNPVSLIKAGLVLRALPASARQQRRSNETGVPVIHGAWRTRSVPDRDRSEPWARPHKLARHHHITRQTNRLVGADPQPNSRHPCTKNGRAGSCCSRLSTDHHIVDDALGAAVRCDRLSRRASPDVHRCVARAEAANARCINRMQDCNPPGPSMSGVVRIRCGAATLRLCWRVSPGAAMRA